MNKRQRKKYSDEIRFLINSLYKHEYDYMIDIVEEIWGNKEKLKNEQKNRFSSIINKYNINYRMALNMRKFEREVIKNGRKCGFKLIDSKISDFEVLEDNSISYSLDTKYGVNKNKTRIILLNKQYYFQLLMMNKKLKKLRGEY